MESPLNPNNSHIEMQPVSQRQPESENRNSDLQPSTESNSYSSECYYWSYLVIGNTLTVASFGLCVWLLLLNNNESERLREQAWSQQTAGCDNSTQTCEQVFGRISYHQGPDFCENPAKKPLCPAVSLNSTNAAIANITLYLVSTACQTICISYHPQDAQSITALIFAIFFFIIGALSIVLTCTPANALLYDRLADRLGVEAIYRCWSRENCAILGSASANRVVGDEVDFPFQYIARHSL